MIGVGVFLLGLALCAGFTIHQVSAKLRDDNTAAALLTIACSVFVLGLVTAGGAIMLHASPDVWTVLLLAFLVAALALFVASAVSRLRSSRADRLMRRELGMAPRRRLWPQWAIFAAWFVACFAACALYAWGLVFFAGDFIDHEWDQSTTTQVVSIPIGVLMVLMIVASVVHAVFLQPHKVAAEDRRIAELDRQWRTEHPGDQQITP